MKKTTMMKWAMLGLLGILAYGARAAEISQVTVRQRWPWSRLVDIEYVLSDATQEIDIKLTAFDGTTELSLPPESLSGDLYGVSGSGVRRIVWDPIKTAYKSSEVLAKFKVSLTPTPAPLYMIMDLTKEAGDVGHLEFVYEADIRDGTWGTWEEDPVSENGTAIKSVVWTDVTNTVYKTDKLVLRRIPAGSAILGSPTTEHGRSSSGYETQRPVRITEPFYIGVYALTQRQWEHVGLRSRPSYWNNAADWETRPTENVKYYELRENPSNSADPDYTWPSKGHAVHPGSFMGLLRAKSGGAIAFDLPTDSQWEYACRAGTMSAFNDGTTHKNNNENANLNLLGRNRFNGGQIYVPDVGWKNPEDGTYGIPRANVTAENATAKVGIYQPNAWGLYDMHGSIFEYCLDYHTTDLDDSQIGNDPVGAGSGERRAARGGAYDCTPVYCRSAYRTSYLPGNSVGSFGFRVAASAAVLVPQADP